MWRRLLLDVPQQFHDAIRQERQVLRELATVARGLAAVGDIDGLWALAEEISRAVTAGNYRAGGHLRRHWFDIESTLDTIFDEAFPVRDPADPVDLLDGPWPTRSRITMLAAITGAHWVRRDALIERARATGDLRLMRLIVVSPVGSVSRAGVVQMLDALAAADELDTEVVEHAFLDDLYLGYAVLGRSPADGSVEGEPAACAGAVRPFFDELVWRLTATPDVAWDAVPKVLTPRGLRFVLRALTWTGDRKVAEFLGAADLTGAEQEALIDHLRGRPGEEQQRAFAFRVQAGDAEVILPLLGMADAADLLRLIVATSPSEVVRVDRAAIVAAGEVAGTEAAERLLQMCPSELVSAAMGWNRTAVEKRVKNNALVGIAAFGLLPLAVGESVLDRYVALREIAKRGPKLGPNRRLSHAAAVDVALDHLAQVAGVPDPSRFEWDCEARIAADSPGEWAIDGYTVAVRAEATDAFVTVSRAGKQLKSVPAAVRAHPSYAQCREHQERLRAQARRMRTGLIERLVATGATVHPDELTRLRSLPSAAAMLPALIWQDSAGSVGLLDQVDTAGPLTAMHPFHLFERGLLARWQAEVVRLRLTQPVKQAFRELYLLTPNERDAGTASARFAGHIIHGKLAAQLLGGRGWSVLGEHGDYQAKRSLADGLTAVLRCDLQGYFGMGDVTTGEVCFLTRAHGTAGVVPLADVPAVMFSEVMRDLDLVVSVANTGAYHDSPSQVDSRAQLLAALIGDLGLKRVTMEGTSAIIHGSRATYRVHLNSGSIHIEPGGYLCIVPATFGTTAHRRLFLPFVDEDRMTSIVLSKIMLLNDDEKIADPSILAQIEHATG